ncbi:MAG TPA: alpha/beta hydrolase [Anaerolineales bacterium]
MFTNVKHYLSFSIALSVVILGGLVLAACQATVQQSPAVAPVPAGAQAGDLLDVRSCAFQADGSKTIYQAECSTLIVPENWDKAGSRLIALPIVRILATGPDAAEPVFWLVGGPGGSNLGWEPPAWLLKNRDAVMVGYRGEDGTVILKCPGFGQQVKAHLGVDMFSEKAYADLGAAARQCAAGYEQAGVDLTGYTMPQVIEDMEAARKALGYDRIDLFSESYGTRVAQVYAYMYPESLKRVLQISVNTPGHFLYDRKVLDSMIRHLADLCAQDAYCGSRTDDFAQTMYDVNRSMPDRWLFLKIDPDTVRLGTQFMMYDHANLTTVFDVYLAAGEGDYSGLAFLNLVAKVMYPADALTYGDSFSKAGTADLPRYGGIDSINLGDSIMGAPHSEFVWPSAATWPLELIPEDLRNLQESDVEMLLINGTVDFATPATALDEAAPYWHKAQMVLLPEFSHVNDIYTMQPAAYERLITSYLDTGVGDASLYVYEPLDFKMDVSNTVVAKALVAAMIILPLLLILAVFLIVRRIRRRSAQRASTAPVI